MRGRKGEKVEGREGGGARAWRGDIRRYNDTDIYCFLLFIHLAAVVYGLQYFSQAK